MTNAATKCEISGPPSRIFYDTSSNAFHADLRARVQRYFRMTQRSPRDLPAMYVKTAVVLAWFAASYALLVFACTEWWQAVPAAISLGFSIAAIGFNVQHDGGHRAYSSRGWVNRIMALTIEVIGGSAYLWARKHNTLHHTYTNLAGHDDDIELGYLACLSPHQKRLAPHRLQHIYLWGLYSFLGLKWHLFDDFFHVARGRIGSYSFPRPRGWDLVTFITGKAIFYFLAFGLPLLFHPVGVVVLFYLLSSALVGVVLSVVFQLAHVVEEAEFPQPDPATGEVDRSWAVHQVETTVDFARRNRVLSWFVGGLNFQVEHHLFPTVCHLHYPKISRIVEKACRKAGVQYRSHPTVWSALRSHYRWLRRMGRPVAA